VSLSQKIVNYIVYIKFLDYMYFTTIKLISKGGYMFVGAFRKTIGLFLIAFGIGAVITLFLPLWLWVLIVAAVLMVFGFIWLLC
jgi:hypothetical protein